MKTILLPLSIITGVFGFNLDQEKCLTEAWNAYNQRDWKLAKQHAEDCTFTHAPAAFEIQENEEANNAALPTGYTKPNGLSAAEKRKIVTRGLLNDVATSFYIVGMCNERLDNKPDAIKAYKKAAKLHLGLCYDGENNAFWSPAEASEKRLKFLAN